MSQAYMIDGLDEEKGTVVVEIHKTLLVRVCECLRECPERNNNRIHVPIRELADDLRLSARVLYAEVDADVSGLPIYGDAEAA